MKKGVFLSPAVFAACCGILLLVPEHGSVVTGLLTSGLGRLYVFWIRGRDVAATGACTGLCDCSQPILAFKISEFYEEEKQIVSSATRNTNMLLHHIYLPHLANVAVPY